MQLFDIDYSGFLLYEICDFDFRAANWIHLSCVLFDSF